MTICCSGGIERGGAGGTVIVGESCPVCVVPESVLVESLVNPEAAVQRHNGCKFSIISREFTTSAGVSAFTTVVVEVAEVLVDWSGGADNSLVDDECVGAGFGVVGDVPTVIPSRRSLS